jgi:hypothetical protein
MLVKLDSRKYGRQTPGALLASRRPFMKYDATKVLKIEFLDYDCGWAGFKWRTFIRPHRNELALKPGKITPSN